MEEENLIRIYASTSRRKVMRDLISTLKHIADDPEMEELIVRGVEKLNNMSDEEFAKMDIIAAE